MPQVAIKTGFVDAEGREETLTEYLCDWPDCPNVAEEVLGVITELRVFAAICRQHAAALKPKPAA
jgi:hypothetical protein